MANEPVNMPPDFESALGYIMGVTEPTVDDFKLMAYIEAGGEAFYQGLANAAPSPEIAELLMQNGREERAHAHRCKRVVEKLSGEPFEVPAPDDNPYYVVPEGLTVDAEMLNGLVEGEDAGDVLYQGWAAGMDDAECAKLLRQNGKEEIRHGERCKQALALL
ncbi:MAG: ferritin family protein [Gammaproteobacteria bacterium]